MAILFSNFSRYILPSTEHFEIDHSALFVWKWVSKMIFAWFWSMGSARFEVCDCMRKLLFEVRECGKKYGWKHVTAWKKLVPSTATWEMRGSKHYLEPNRASNHILMYFKLHIFCNVTYLEQQLSHVVTYFEPRILHATTFWLACKYYIW